jgi:phosphoglycerate kinase
MSIQSIQQSNIKNKRVLLRVDFNVPLKGNKVLDDFKMQRAYKTIRFLLKNDCNIVLVSHLGRPKGKRLKAMSLEPVCKHFKKTFKSTKFFNDAVTNSLTDKVNQYKGRIAFLENLRYDNRETNNNKAYAQILAGMAEVYVNEAFAFSHRKTATMVAITKLLPSYGGFNLIDEVKYLEKVLKPKKPSVAIIGGSKLATKNAVIKKFVSKYNKVLIGGGLANTFLAAKGYQLGSSIGIDKKEINKAKPLLKSKKIILPRDVIIADKKTKRKVRYEFIQNDKFLCDKDEMILDIGPETQKYYSTIIKSSKTIVWNGPLGYTDDKKFQHGSVVIGKAIASRSSGKALGIVGGGETLFVLKLTKMSNYIDFISTGGGALLTFLEGSELPGLKSLKY